MSLVDIPDLFGGLTGNLAAARAQMSSTRIKWQFFDWQIVGSATFRQADKSRCASYIARLSQNFIYAGQVPRLTEKIAAKFDGGRRPVSASALARRIFSASA
jgi:hypothetical protein